MSASVTPPLPIEAPRRRIDNVDHWLRLHSKYRVRALVLIIFNLLLFCGLCIFTYWLHTARLFDFSPSGYLDPFQFWGEQPVTLHTFLRYPIDVSRTPIHGAVLGLLVASIVAVPIAVAILYRFYAALPFIAAIVIFAHMPWMAITLTGSCILASAKPFRMRFRFGSALVGLLPILLYLVMANRSGADTLLLSEFAPDQRPLLITPWVLAVLAAAGMLATILWIASIVQYRPGAVAPVLAIMVAAPTVLFFTKVGDDELVYRVLELEYGPQAARYTPSKSSAVIEQQLQDMLRELNPSVREFAIYWAQDGGEALRQRAVRKLLTNHLEERDRAERKCNAFLRDHPRSRYVPNVLYIKGIALDRRLTTNERSWQLEQDSVYADFPHPASSETWQVLWSTFPDSPLSLTAGLRLAQLSLRRGAVDTALQQLDALEARAITLEPVINAPPAPGLFQESTSIETLGVNPMLDVAEGARIAALVRANRDDPRFGATALQARFSLDRQRRGYRDALKRVYYEFQESLLADNLLLAWIQAEPQVDERRRLLAAFSEIGATGDALPEAIYALAELEIQTLAVDQVEVRAAGRHRMAQLAADFPDSYWGQQAARRIASFASVARN